MGRGKVKGGKPEDHDQLWTAAGHENRLFEAYYKAAGVIPEAEWPAFLASLRSPLPTTFRINQLNPVMAAHLLQQLRQKWVPEIQRVADEEAASSTAGPTEGAAAGPDAVVVKPPETLPWYPSDMGWGMDISRRALKKYPALKQFHQFVMLETAEAHFLRQEAVSMVPPLFMDLRADSVVLDMCAAPGSKTTQLLELLGLAAHAAGVSPTGVVIANDLEFKRCEVLVTQTQRLSQLLPNLITINHDGRLIPNLHLADTRLEFDRILCDASCSGDGTIRKSPDLWRKWCPRLGHGAHKIQMRLLDKSMMLCRLGGRIVYSTCSMNPIEDEAVVLHCLLRARGRYELCDTAGQAAGLQWSAGLTRWPVMLQDGQLVASFDEVPEAEKKHVWNTMFPIPDEAVARALHLERCMRFLPHIQNTGGFFVAVLQKVREQPDPDFFPLPFRPGAATQDAVPPATGGVAAAGPTPDDAPPLPEDDDGTAEKPSAGKGNPKFKNDSLTDYLVPIPKEVVDEIRSRFEFAADFPFDRLMHRSRASPKKVYFVNELARGVLAAMHASQRWRIVGAGVRIFEKSGPKMDEQYRMAHEGLAAVFPFMPSHRVVGIGHADLLAILRIPSRSVALKAIAGAGTREALEALAEQRGGGPVILRCTEQLLGTAELLLSARVSGAMMFTFCHKEDLPSVLHRMGEEPATPTAAPAAAPASPGPGAASPNEEAVGEDAGEPDAPPSKRPRVSE